MKHPIIPALLLLCGAAVAATPKATGPGAVIEKAQQLLTTPATADTERQLQAELQKLAAYGDDPRVYEFVQAISQRAPQVWVEFEEGHTLIPAADPGARPLLRAQRTGQGIRLQGPTHIRTGGGE